MSIDKTILLIQEQIPKTRTFALLRDLRYAVRGGRLPAWVKAVADLMRLKPIIATRPDGSISLAGFLFGTRKRTDRFARFVARRAPKNQEIDVGIGHAICENDANALEREIRLKIPAIKKLVINGLGPGLGVHGGPGTLLITISPTVSLNDIANGVD